MKNSIILLISIISISLFSGCVEETSPVGNSGETSGNQYDSLTVVIGTMTDPRDNQTYETTTINGRTWLGANLNFVTPTSRVYDDDPANGSIYGRLYTWEDALTAVPSGWRLATVEDWEQLDSALGENAGSKLKSLDGWIESDFPDLHQGTNEVGFNGVASGRWNMYDYQTLNQFSGYWLYDEVHDTTDNSIYGVLGYDKSWMTTYYRSKEWAFSVRCVKND